MWETNLSFGVSSGSSVPREEMEGEAREGVADDEEAIESAGVGWNALCVCWEGLVCVQG
jgi:hypothetical protein